MDKINFINNNSPYLSSDNLNQIQDNVENAFKNEYSESTVDGYSANYINHFGKHSLTEGAYTGKTWINRKTNL